MGLPTDISAAKHPNHRPFPASRHSNPHYLEWTPAHEKRLQHVQTQLAKAQAEWSEEQEIWLDEVHELEERKRKYKKALKKEKRRGGKKGTLWRTHSGYSTASMGESSDEDDDDEGEKAEEADVPNTQRTPRGFAIRRMSANKRASSYSEGETIGIPRSQTSPSTPTFSSILRWWSGKGGKGKQAEVVTRDFTPLKVRRRLSS
jgi:hypothetical protein